MRIRRIIVYWTVFSIFLIVGYSILQFLHSINFWTSIGVSTPPDRIEPLSTIGTTFFFVSLIGGWSLIFSSLIWIGIGKAISPAENSVTQLILEIIRSWITLSFVEIFSVTIYAIFTSMFTGTVFTLSTDLQLLLEVAWINLILILMFYTFLGLQAYRKNLQISTIVRKSIFDTLHILILTLEGFLILIPRGLFEIIIDMRNYPPILISALAYSYNVFLLVFVIEIMNWIEQKTKAEEEEKSRIITIRIFVLNTTMIIVPLLVLPTFLIIPFYIPFSLPDFWLFLMILLPLLSIPMSIVYHFFKILAHLQSKDGLSQYDILKYRFELFLSERGTMFDYPTPIDIFIGGELTEKIEHRWEKVTLKFACGQCFHVFSADTYKKGTTFKPIPCKFCGSSATTPVWE